MVHAVESVTLAVAEPAAALRFFRDQLGWRVLYDARASVGLLSAWHYPVHEAVRLIELARDSSPTGRIRLALYEDAPQRWAASSGSTTARTALRTGPVAIDLRAAAEPQGPLANSVVHPLADGSALAILGRTSPAARAHSGGGDGFAAVWLLTADGPRAAHFYQDVLGYGTVSSGETSAADAPELGARLGLGAGRVRLSVLRAPGASVGGVALLELTDSPEAQPGSTMRPGAPGINLITCQCDALDEVLQRLCSFGIEPDGAPLHVGLPDGRRGRVLTVRGPSRELIELVEDTD